MTTEQKAKAYDEALKRAIAAHKDEDRHLKATLERIFPELKESEDEKIRKVLKHYLEVRRCQTQSDEEYINCNNFLAWLEKQGKTLYTEKDLGELADKYYNEVLIGECGMSEDQAGHCRLSYYLGLKEMLEKQGEQEFAEKVESKFKVKYAGNEYNVLDVKENMGITWYGIEDEPNHIDYVKANSCEIISGYAIKENGSPYPTKIAVFSEQKPTDEDMKEALRTEYEKGRADTIAEIGEKFDDCRRRQEIMHLCYECIFLTSDVIGRWRCTRPDGTGNYKAHPYVGACSEHFKPKSKNENKKEE